MGGPANGSYDDDLTLPPEQPESPEQRRHVQHAPREVEFHLTLSEEDRELLDTLAHRMNCSRTEAIARALHLLDAVQAKAAGDTTGTGEARQ